MEMDFLIFNFNLNGNVDLRTSKEMQSFEQLLNVEVKERISALKLSIYRDMLKPVKRCRVSVFEHSYFIIWHVGLCSWYKNT